jgi:hypothetical protein
MEKNVVHNLCPEHLSKRFALVLITKETYMLNSSAESVIGLPVIPCEKQNCDYVDIAPTRSLLRSFI